MSTGYKANYEFETIDNLGIHTPHYYRLNKNTFTQGRTGCSPLQNSRTLDTLNTAHHLAIHRSNDNSFINNHVPHLSVTNKSNLILRNRAASPFAAGSPLKDYTARLTIPAKSHASPIFSNNLHNHPST